jgi:hypothetical protein
MAFPYYPASYANPYIPQMYQNQYIPQQQAQQNGFLAAWIQGGEQSMKSYTLTGANQKVYLFSTDENIFGVKSSDANGMPLPLEVFRYERINADKPQNAPTAASVDTSVFITREEFEARIAQICASDSKRRSQKKEVAENGE